MSLGRLQINKTFSSPIIVANQLLHKEKIDSKEQMKPKEMVSVIKRAVESACGPIGDKPEVEECTIRICTTRNF